MILLTKEQKLWFFKKTIKTNNIYMFPRFGFTVYSEPNYASGVDFDTNPFTKSLDDEMFFVKEKVNGFCRGNFYKNEKCKDWWMCEDELSNRGIIESLVLFILCVIPIIIYNIFRSKKNL